MPSSLGSGVGMRNNPAGNSHPPYSIISERASARILIYMRMPWVEDLSPGSFLASLRAVHKLQDHAPVKASIERYVEVGRTIRDGRIESLPMPIRAAARKIVGVIGDRVTSIRFENEDDDAEIFAPSLQLPLEPALVEEEKGSLGAEEIFVIRRPSNLKESYGALRGKVQSLTNRNALRFTLYEINSDRAVSCYIQPGNEDLMRKAWGEMVLVEGVVHRDPNTGLPTTMRRVRNITIIPPVEPKRYRRAIGCAPAMPGEESAEAAIRRLRDGER